MSRARKSGAAAHGGSKPRLGEVAATEWIKVRATPADAERWRAAAAANGQTLAEYVRAALEAKVADPDGELRELVGEIEERSRPSWRRGCGCGWLSDPGSSCARPALPGLAEQLVELEVEGDRLAHRRGRGEVKGDQGEPQGEAVGGVEHGRR